MHRSSFRSALALIAVLTPFPSLAQPLNIEREFRFEMSPYQVRRSGYIEVLAGRFVNVDVRATTAGASAPFVVTRVFDTADKLLAVENLESALSDSRPFQWVSTRSDKYIFELRNLSDRTGVAIVQIVRPRSAPTSAVKPIRPSGTVLESNYARVRVFFATNRQPARANDKPPLFSFDEGEKTRYGYLDVSIPHPEKRRIGALESPSLIGLDFWWDPGKHVMVLENSMVIEDRDVLMKRLSQWVRFGSKKELLVFVHGFNTSFYDAARRTAQIAYDLGFGGVPFFFSWPSKEISKFYVDAPFVYGRDRESAINARDSLREVLTELARSSGAERIHLIAHSMGNQVLTRALAEMALAGNAPKFRHIAMLAPDVNVNEFRKLSAVFRQTSDDKATLYASNRDWALMASKLFQSYPRAGQAGNGLLIMEQVDTIDASAVDTWIVGFGHDYFGRVEPVLSDLGGLINKDLAPPGRGLASRNGHWVLGSR